MGPFCYLCFVFVMLFVCSLQPWVKANIWALLYVMIACVFVTFSCGVLGQVMYLIVSIVSISGLCLLKLHTL